MLMAFQAPELLMTGVCPGAASKVMGALAVPLVVMSSTSPPAGRISAIHDLDSVTGLHQVRGCLQAGQGSTGRCACVVVAADLRAHIVRDGICRNSHNERLDAGLVPAEVVRSQ